MKKIKTPYKVISTILLITLIVSCNSRNRNVGSIDIMPESITIQGDKFVDNNGRQVILNGYNISSKNKENGYIFQSGPELYENLNKWGVNCIRFIIIWDRLEPEPGVFNEEYLKEIDERINWAKENNVFVILDMHQDLFSVKYSDGAPEWATLDEGKPHTTGAIWSDAYVLSEAVQKSFDNFWLNKPASDGLGIQDHYALLWKHIASRYANNTTVIGYDIMNEPFPGSSGVQSTMVLLSAYGQLHYKLTGEVLTEEQLGSLWGEEKSRLEALEILSTKDNYDFVFSKLFEINKEFESNALQEMYQKVSQEIRKVDNKHILFLEHSYFSNTGVRSSIERVKLKDGSPDPLVAYAPHGYDLVTDTEAVGSASNERVAYIYEQIENKGAQLKMPVWLGEWGAYYGNSEGVLPAAKYAVNQIEKGMFGNAYWSYNLGDENLEYFKKVLLRVYPMFINGRIIAYKNDFEKSQFSIEWAEGTNNDAPSIIYLPELSRLNKDEIKGFEIHKINNSDAGYLIIPVSKENRRRILTLNLQN